MNRLCNLGAITGLAACVLAPSSTLGIVSWSNPTGTAPGGLFSWAGGYEINGLFGDPVVTGNTMTFAPPAFFAASPGNISRSDTLHVDITVLPGQTITGVTINELGTRTHINPTTSIQGTLHIKDLTIGSLSEFTDSLVFTNDTSTAPIGWTGTVTRSSLGFGEGVHFHLDLTNNMTATSSGRNIHKNGVEIIFTPAPGTFVGFSGLLGLALGRRHRRSV